MTDELQISFERESNARLAAAREQLRRGDGLALRLELHRWRVAARAFGVQPSELLALERHVGLETLVQNAFHTEESLRQPRLERLSDPITKAGELHRLRRAARAAGTGLANDLIVPPVVNHLIAKQAPALRVSAPTTTSSSQPAAEETVRVAVSKLDALLALSGELRVEQIRATNRASNLSALLVEMQDERRQWRKRRAEPSQLLERFRERTRAALKELAALERQMVLDNAHLKTLTQSLEDEVLGARLLPAALLLPPLERLVRDLSQQLGKRVRFVMSGSDVELDRKIIDGLRDPLMHMVRNALDHGFETISLRSERDKPLEGTLSLGIYSDGSTVTIGLSDDGAGIDGAAVRRRALEKGLIADNHEMTEAEVFELIFAPGFSTAATVTETSGRGVGMDVLRENIARLGGQITVASQAGLGSQFTLRLPMQLATSRVLIVQITATQVVALPTRDLERTGRIKTADLITVGGVLSVQGGGQAVSYVELGALLGAPSATSREWQPFVMLKSSSGQSIACGVDALLNEQEVVVKRLGYPLEDVPHLSGAALLGSGQLAPILNVSAIFERAQRASSAFSARPAIATPPAAKRRRILVVDDSVTTRTLERSILEAAGFETRTAMDGLQALELLNSFDAELVLSDVEMPHLDGFGLTLELRRNPRTQHIPVILVTSLDQPEHKERGALAGADAYIVKGEFNQQSLLETIGRLL